MAPFEFLYILVFSFASHAVQFISHWESQPTSCRSCKFGGTAPGVPWFCRHL